MKKVFYRCTETDSPWWTVQKEYEADDRGVINDLGDLYCLRDLGVMTSFGGKRPRGWSAGFTRIERETFEAHGQTWFKHVPGEPMPCDSSVAVSVWLREGVYGGSGMADAPSWRTAGRWNWSTSADHGNQIIGWRYADAQASEPELRLVLQNDEPVWNNEPTTVHAIAGGGDGAIDFPSPKENDEMIFADMPIAAMDPGHLTPSQRKHIDAMEEKQSAKERLQHDAETKALQERADSLNEAGRAMDRVKQSHDHKLGWMA